MTPFENVMRVFKQAGMLIEEVEHNWAYPTPDSRYYTVLPEEIYVYEGAYVCVTQKAAQMLLSLFKELKDVKCARLAYVVTVWCLDENRRDLAEELGGARNDTF